MPRTTTSPVDAEAVGRRIRATREALGLSQAALADRLDVSPAYLNKLEAGRGNPTIGSLARIATALGCRLAIDFELMQQTGSSAVDVLAGAP
ncbi:helix-turn-helix domain-containing protein [Solirubrobacter soli]|uniref:helix-turn-helix domain-containing protein n=1 Tax=Solirubrobacter soli TaxID=363832 RepID=UPI000428EF1C|nr:helix-turn-helix transcriptional regulator [Solirubrobacter soli]